MGEIPEEFISGFCRTICCEYEQGDDGSVTLTEFDCNPEKCPNSAACTIWEEAKSRERKG